jgi:periplasmic protein TonB
VAPAAPKEEPAVLEKSEIMPEYPGGPEALKRFLLKNLRFDFEDQEPGTRIEIRCRFVVDKEGKVTGIEIVKSAGRSEYDKEVTRVVTKMPAWKPGIQNGRTVSVYFTLPVIVEVPEQ